MFYFAKTADFDIHFSIEIYSGIANRTKKLNKVLGK